MLEARLEIVYNKLEGLLEILKTISLQISTKTPKEEDDEHQEAPPAAKNGGKEDERGRGRGPRTTPRTRRSSTIANTTMMHRALAEVGEDGCFDFVTFENMCSCTDCLGHSPLVNEQPPINEESPLSAHSHPHPHPEDWLNSLLFAGRRLRLGRQALVKPLRLSPKEHSNYIVGQQDGQQVDEGISSEKTDKKRSHPMDGKTRAKKFREENKELTKSKDKDRKSRERFMAKFGELCLSNTALMEAIEPHLDVDMSRGLRALASKSSTCTRRVRKL